MHFHLAIFPESSSGEELIYATRMKAREKFLHINEKFKHIVGTKQMLTNLEIRTAVEYCHIVLLS